MGEEGEGRQSEMPNNKNQEIKKLARTFVSPREIRN